MRVGYIRSAKDTDNAFEMNSVLEYLARLPGSDDRDVLLNNLGYQTYPHVISLSGYNRLLDNEFVSPAKLRPCDRQFHYIILCIDCAGC